MTGIDEHIRTINRAIARLYPEFQGSREAARTALHHIAAREQRQRERINWLEQQSFEWDKRVKELEDKLKRFQVNWDKLCEMHEAEQARVQELEANQYEGRIDRIPRVQELEGGIEARDAINIKWRNRVQEVQDKLRVEVNEHEATKDEVERLRGIIYRITAPTASQVEEDDRAAAFEEGRELTDPNAARTARWKARYPSDS